MAEDALETTIATSGKARHFEQGAMIVMETDGAVRALVGGKDYGESQFNRATHAYRQPGSSFKPYVYLTAFETGKYTPNTVVSGGGAACGHWAPHNFAAGESNTMALHDALAHSINTIAVKVSLDVGREKVLETMAKLGITRLKKTCSLALGDQGLTPLEHVTNYAVFASGGLEVHSYAIEEIRGLASGAVVYNHDRDTPPRKQLFSRKSVEMLNTMMQQVVQAGTARAANLDFTYAIGKTGTSSNFRDAWFMGITGQYVAGVWLGNDDFTPMARVTGGSFPAQTWHNFMVAAHDTDNIAQIPGIAVHPVQVAEQARLAAAAAQNAAANPEAAPTPAPENVKDMSLATKQVLDKIAALLKDARRLAPSDQKADHAEASPPPAPAANPNLAAGAGNADGTPHPATASAADPQTSPQGSLSTVSDSGAPAPH
jgi:penicillin-binding protein 1A